MRETVDPRIERLQAKLEDAYKAANSLNTKYDEVLKEVAKYRTRIVWLKETLVKTIPYVKFDTESSAAAQDLLNDINGLLKDTVVKNTALITRKEYHA